MLWQLKSCPQLLILSIQLKAASHLPHTRLLATRSYSNTPGASACLACTGGLGTRGMKGQSKCVKQF